MNDMTAIRTNLAERLEAARVKAINGGLPMRRSDGKLYALLADCLSLCELVRATESEAELRDLVRVSVDKRNPDLIGKGRGQSNAGRGRRYAHFNSDVFILVCRYVLPETETAAARSRYSAALREANKRGIASADLSAWLAKNGGVNTLFKARPLEARTVTTKTLHLNSAITISKDEVFTVTLRRDQRGFFDVVTA